MEFRIQKQVFKALVERDEITFRILKTDKTPSKKQVREAAAKMLKKDSDLVVVKHVFQKFGETGARAEIYVYKNKEAVKKFETKTKGKKKKAAGGEKKEEVKEEKKEEQKAE